MLKTNSNLDSIFEISVKIVYLGWLVVLQFAGNICFIPFYRSYFRWLTRVPSTELSLTLYSSKMRSMAPLYSRLVITMLSNVHGQSANTCSHHGLML